jgi:hypothetical protein
MNDKTGGNRGPRCAVVLAVVAAVAMLAAACGGGSSSAPSSASSPSALSATYRAELAFAQCMRSHGAPNFPDPAPGETVHAPANATGPKAQSYDACKQLLPRGTATTDSGHITTQQFNQAVKVAQCVRTHGEPNFPEPTLVNGYADFVLQAGMDPQSAQFQAAVNACRSLIPKGVKFP